MILLTALFAGAFALPSCGDSEDSDGGNPKPDASTDGGTDAANDASSDAPPPDAGVDAIADAPDAPNDASDGAASWTLPECTSVTGTGAVTFTKDDGATLAPTSETLTGTVYTMGLVALETPNTLLAASGPSLLRSEDAGCSWTAVATLPSSLMILARGRGDRAFGWVDNDQPLVRIDGTTVTPLKNPVGATLGFAADPVNPDRARLAGGDGTLWETTDGGATWDPIGSPPGGGSLFLPYRFRFDPNDLDHILFGSASTGASVSFDGGSSWQPSDGLTYANVFELAVSPVDSSIVWAEGIDLAENLADGGPPSEGRHIFRSTDGGKTFVPVVDHVPGQVTLTNGLPLVPHPTDANVVYFEFGSYFQAYGTDVFRFDAATKQLAKTHNPYDDVLAMAFSPADPSLMYLGITSVQIQ